MVRATCVAVAFAAAAYADAHATTPGPPVAWQARVRPVVAAAGATDDRDQHVALRGAPTPGATPRLLLFLPGSAMGPGKLLRVPPSLYDAALLEGYHVLGVAYRTEVSMRQLCDGQPLGCAHATRRALLEGPRDDASPLLADMAVGEAILPRLVDALEQLVRDDPDGGWDAFLIRTAPPHAPIAHVRWNRVAVAGYSLGAGQATLIAQTVAVERLVILSGPCDEEARAPAGWLGNASVTDLGRAAHAMRHGDDASCTTQQQAWDALGVDATRRHLAASCDARPHAAPALCTENLDTWRAMLR